MSKHDDDLSGWADDDLVRALRAPGTAQELADQELYVSAFRDAHPGKPRLRSLPRRAAGRLGAGGTAVVVTVALSSGVAAAYTGNLPDPVQSAVSSVVPGVPDGSSNHTQKTDSSHGGTGVVPPSSTTSTAQPSNPTSPTSAPTPSVGTSHPPQGGGNGPTGGPTTAPTTAPTTGPTDSTSSPTGDPGSGSSAAGMTMGAPTHRVLVDQTLTLSSLVTATDGTPVAGQEVVLQVRAPRRWRPLTTATTDATGTATVTTPPVTQSARFRWHTVPHVHSTIWRVRMVPTMTTSAAIGGATTVITVGTLGGVAGDRVLLLRWAQHQLVPAQHGRLDASASIAFTVPTPPRHSVYAVRLLPTRKHAAARSRVPIQPPTVASASISAPSHRVGVGVSLPVSGVIQDADGTALAGRRVLLQVRGPQRWRNVGSAITDADGSVVISTPPARVTTRYRLRAPNGVHSDPWRVAMVPAINASASPDGAITATATGGRPGDRVVLLRRVGGRLVKVQHGFLDASGNVTFQVTPKRNQTAYVVRLLATKRHGPATARVTVPGTG